MAHKYPREIRRILAINGIFDDFSDTTFSMASWEDTSELAYHSADHTYEYIAAPGAVGGNALHLKGKIITPGNGLNDQEVGDMYCSISPYRNRSSMYYYSLDTWGKWGMKAEFRMRIADDEASSSSDEYLAQSAGFCIDGTTVFDLDSPPAESCNTRIMVNFSVANQRAGIAITPLNQSAWHAPHSIYDEAWAGSLDTWYDVRIEWEFDWYADSENPFTVRVFVNNIELFEQTIHYLDWRVGIETDLHFSYPSSIGVDDSVWGITGKCGPQLSIGTATGGTPGNYVEAYYKDILITQYPARLINAKFDDSIFERNRPNTASMIFVCNAGEIGQGSDIQLHLRRSKNDDWGGEPEWRGIIREVKKVSKRIVKVEAESYFSLLTGERADHLTYTSQTTAQIIIDALAHPTKYEFNTSDYFDSVSAIYTREYQQLPKFEIVEEMMGLEGYLFYLDHGLNIHYEDPRKYESGVHLEFGVNVIDAKEDQIFVQQPNIVRVNGNGYTAAREIIGASFGSRSRVIRNISRLDLVTQAEVDDALDYYISLYTNLPIILKLVITPNWALKKGQLVKVTVPHYSIHSIKFIITSKSYSDETGLMTIGVLQSSFDIGTITSDIGKRSSASFDPDVPQDTIDSDEWLTAEFTAIAYIQGEFEIEYNSQIVRSGKLTITNGHIERLLDMLDDGNPTKPSYIGIGTGTTPPEFSDTTLDTETGSRVQDLTPNDLEKCSFRSIDTKAIGQYLYRAIQWECDFTDPSSITEIGVFDTSTSGLLFARAVFDSYTQTGTVTFRAKFRTIPRPGAVYPTTNLCITNQRWWNPQITNFTGWGGSNLKARVWGTRFFLAPNPQMWSPTLPEGSLKLLPDGWNTPSGAVRTSEHNDFTQTYKCGLKSSTFTISAGLSSYMNIGFGFGVAHNYAGGEVTSYREYPLVLGFFRDYQLQDAMNGKKINFVFNLKLTQGYIEDVQ